MAVFVGIIFLFGTWMLLKLLINDVKRASKKRSKRTKSISRPRNSGLADWFIIEKIVN